MPTQAVEHVRVARPDRVLDEIAPAAESVFQKVGTQGDDRRVLRGAAGGLRRVAAVDVELPVRRFYEGSADYLETLAWLRRRGVEPVNVSPGALERGLLAELDRLLRRAPNPA